MKYLAILILSALPALAAPTLVQQCNQTNSTFFSTTTASCTLGSPIGANHLIVVMGYSCLNTCYSVGVQATHAVTDSQTLSYSAALNTVFNSPRRGGNVARESVWYVETGATTGSDTVTLTLNTAAGNGILVTEWSGVATSSPVVTSNATSGSFAGGGSAPITYTGGTLVIGGTNNTIIAEANLNSASDWLIQAVAFQAVSGNDLIYVHADCENCGGLHQNIPATYTKIQESIGSADEVDMNVDALPFSHPHARSQVY